MSVPFADFRDMVAGVEVDEALTWDFKMASGVTLAGTPVVTVSVYEHSEVDDPDPQSHLGTPQIGTAAGGGTNCAVLAKFGPAVAGVRYLFTVSCPKSVGVGVAACFNHILARSPA